MKTFDRFANTDESECNNKTVFLEAVARGRNLQSGVVEDLSEFYNNVTMWTSRYTGVHFMSCIQSLNSLFII